MRTEQVERGPGGTIVLLDSITKVDTSNTGALVVTGSHGGTSSGEFALAVPLKLVIFNDAGVGKDRAGIAALAMLQDKGVAAGAVSHVSARIGDSKDAWENGVISHVNDAARALGLAPGQPLRGALRRLVSEERPAG